MLVPMDAPFTKNCTPVMVPLGAVALADGRLLSWSHDKTLRLWDGQSGACLAVMEGHVGRVDGAQALADGKMGTDGVFQASKIQAKCASKYEAKPGKAPAPLNKAGFCWPSVYPSMPSSARWWERGGRSHSWSAARSARSIRFGFW